MVGLGLHGTSAHCSDLVTLVHEHRGNAGWIICQREDVPALVGTAYDDLPQKRLEEDLC